MTALEDLMKRDLELLDEKMSALSRCIYYVLGDIADPKMPEDEKQYGKELAEAAARELAVTERVIELLIASGNATEEKVEQARKLALSLK